MCGRLLVFNMDQRVTGGRAALVPNCLCLRRRQFLQYCARLTSNASALENIPSTRFTWGGGAACSMWRHLAGRLHVATKVVHLKRRRSTGRKQNMRKPVFGCCRNMAAENTTIVYSRLVKTKGNILNIFSPPCPFDVSCECNLNGPVVWDGVGFESSHVTLRTDVWTQNVMNIFFTF